MVMSGTGRREDIVWKHFEKVKHAGDGGKVTLREICRTCNQEMVALVARMRKHYEKCNANS